MPTEPILRFVYLTLPTKDNPTLNINASGTHTRYQVTRDQLLDLNRQIADVLVHSRISDKNSFNEQLVLNLEPATL
jgi:hypothetical protein